MIELSYIERAIREVALERTHEDNVERASSWTDAFFHSELIQAWVGAVELTMSGYKDLPNKAYLIAVLALGMDIRDAAQRIKDTDLGIATIKEGE